MKVKIIRRFVDRFTKELREVGKTCEYDADRAGELIRGGYVREVKETKKARVAPVQPEKAGDP